MATVFIGVGSNVNPGLNIAKALSLLANYCSEIAESPCYLSPGIDGAEGTFANLVLRARTELMPHDLVAALKRTESACDRSKSQQTIDLDLLIYDDLCREDDVVKVPRSDIERYPFVLKPLSELAPNERHPKLGLSYTELWAQSDFADHDLTLISRDSLA